MKRSLIFIVSFLFVTAAFAQQFEQPKLNPADFEKVKLDLNADFAMNYQALNHHASDAKLINLGSNFNLPAANLALNSMLAPGIKVNLEVYLSSRHHWETWVKGGYLTIDNLPFIKGSDPLMKYLTFKVGMYQPNVGDQQFRRSDNGNVINNAFVGNYIMDDMTTHTGVEVYFRSKGFLAMAGINNGSLYPGLAGTEKSGADKTYVEYNFADEMAYNWKLSYDKQVNEDLRLRASLSGHHLNFSHNGTLHTGDRAGSRYFLVMSKQQFIDDNGGEFDVAKSWTSGNYFPGSASKDNTIVANLFGKYRGFEIFGTYEGAKGERTNFKTKAVTPYNFQQYAIEGIYRFGKQTQWFVGARYNTVKDTKAAVANRLDPNTTTSVDRWQLAAGWFMTKNIVTKLEYVDQTYNNFKQYGKDAGFKGVMIEAAISF